MKFSSIAGGLLTLALVLAGCEQAVETKAGATFKSLTVTATSSALKYYNLTTGAEVSSDDAATQDWDIAFSSSTGGVFTNSGDTNAAGDGGVYYSGGTEFDAVTSYDTEAFDEDFATDTSRYVETNLGPSGIQNLPTKLNQITKLDYPTGDGLTEGTAYTNDASPGVYDGEAYFAYSGGVYTVSNEVYIVRHGDGDHYSKLQITSLTGSSSSRVRTIKYVNF